MSILRSASLALIVTMSAISPEPSSSKTKVTFEKDSEPKRRTRKKD